MFFKKHLVVLVSLIAGLIIAGLLLYLIQLFSLSNSNTNIQGKGLTLPKEFSIKPIDKPLQLVSGSPVSQKKASIIERISSNIPLTSVEKQTILNEISTTKISNYHLSNQDQQMILKALNNK